MKQKDIALLAVIGIVSAVVAILLSNLSINSPKNRNTEVEVVQAINADFPQPDERYFNEQSIDPAKLITIIGNNDNVDPFGAKQQ